MKTIEIEQEGLKIQFYQTTPEHAKIYGFVVKNPIFLKHLSVDSKKRNKGLGKKLLDIIEEYAQENNYDLIFGHIPNDAEFTKDSRICFFSDIEMIKNWFFRNGYAIQTDNNDFHKVIKNDKPLRFYGGVGFNICAENGEYEIITEHKKTKFIKLSEAKMFYESVKGEKSIWDLKNNELIHSWYFLK